MAIPTRTGASTSSTRGGGPGTACRCTGPTRAGALRSFLGPEIKVHVLTRARGRAGRVAMVAGGGAMAEILEAALERGCETYVTGNAATTCRLDFVQEQVSAFRQRADAAGVTLI